MTKKCKKMQYFGWLRLISVLRIRHDVKNGSKNGSKMGLYMDGWMDGMMVSVVVVVRVRVVVVVRTSQSSRKMVVPAWKYMRYYKESHQAMGSP